MQLASWEAQKMVGIYLVPDKNDKKQVKGIRGKAVE